MLFVDVVVYVFFVDVVVDVVVDAVVDGVVDGVVDVVAGFCNFCYQGCLLFC